MGEKLRQSDIQQDGLFDPTVKSAKEVIEVFDKANKELRETAELLSTLSKTANTSTQKGINAVTTAQKKMNTEFVKAQKIEKITINNSKLLQKERLDEIRLQKAREKSIDDFNKKALREKKIMADSKNALISHNKQLKNARNRYKRLTLELGKNNAKTIQARKNFERLDDKQRELNATTKRGTKALKLFGLSFNTVRGSALQLGAALGLTAGFKELFDITSKQDELNKRLTSSFKLQGEALKDSSTQVQLIADVYDKDVNEVINTATALTNEFNISSSEAFNLIDEGFKKGADVRGEFLDQLSEYSTQFVNVGLSAEEAIAVITQQENKGVFSDKGVDAIKEAGIRLTELPKSTNEALAAIGISGEELQRQITSGQKTVFEATQEISREIAKLPPNASEVGKVLADVFGGAGEDAKGFVLELGNVDTNLDNLEDTTTKYEKAQREFKETFIEIRQEIAERMIPVFTFLAKNLSTIISITVKLGTAFLVYKAGLIATNIAQKVFNTESGKMSFNLKNVVKNLKSGTKANKKFGSALKGIGWAAAISAAYEYFNALNDVIRGTSRLNKELDELADRTGRNEEAATELVEARRLALDTELERIDALNIKESERIKLRKDANTEFKKGLQQDKAEAISRVEELAKLSAKAKELQKENEGSVTFTAELVRETFGDSFFNEGQEKALSMLDIVTKINAEFTASKSRVKIFDDAIGGADNTFQGLTRTSNNFNKTTIEGNKELKEKYKLITDIDSILDSGQSLEEIESDEIAQENAAIQSLLKERLTFINDQERLRTLTTKEAADARKIAQIEALLEQKEILIKYGRDVTDIDLQISQARLSLVGTVKDETIEANEEIKKSYEDLYDKLEDLGNKALDKETEISKKKQQLLNDEISNSQKLEDRLRDSAANQNATAKESLAEQSSITEQKTRDKLAEAKREERIEELKALWAALNNFLSQGDSLPIAGGKAASGVFSLKQIFSNLTGFAKGTKGRLGDEHTAQFGGVDGHVVRVDSEEAILTGSKMDRLAAAGLHTTDEIVNSAIMNQQLIGIPIGNHVDDRSVLNSNAALAKKMDSLISATKANVPYKLDPIFVNGALNGAVQHRKVNGNVERNWNYRK